MTRDYQGYDPLLTKLSKGYTNEQLVGALMLPDLRVDKATGKHWIFDKEAFRAEKTERGVSSNSNEVTHSLTTGLPYSCVDHALKEFVPDEDVDNAAEGRDPMADATFNVTEKLAISREIAAATILRSTGVMTQNTTLSGSSQWSGTGSDPIADIRTAAATIHAATFKKANTLLLGKQVVDKLIDHPAIIERVKFSQLGVLSTDLLARFFDVERVIIGAAGKNTAVQGQSDTIAYVWGKDAILAHIAPSIGQRMLTLGFTYRNKDRRVERLRGSDEEDRKGTIIRVGDDSYDMQLMAAECGYLIKDAVA